MISLPWWASWLVGLLIQGINQWLANRRAEEALRNLGAATQAAASKAEAERQEAVAQAAADAAATAPETDPDPFRRD